MGRLIQSMMWDGRLTVSRKHMEIHSEHSHRYECAHCTHTFRYPKDLWRHQEKHHLDSSGQCFSFPNQNCSHDFCRADALRRHLRDRHAESVCTEKCHHSGSELALTSDGESLIHREFDVSWFNATHSGVKSGLLLTSSACLHIVSNYGRSTMPPFSRGGTTPYTWGLDSVHVRNHSIPRQSQFHADQTKDLINEPQWLAQPHPLLLLAASVGAGGLLVCYHQRNAGDKYQNSFLLMAFVTSMASFLLPGHSLLTTALTTVPWVLYFTLILSDLCHLGLKLRSHARMQCTNDTEKQQLSGSIEGCLGQ